MIKIYVSPFLKESISDNPLKQKERRYPIDMIYPNKRVYNTTISFPEGYIVDFIPGDLNINNELFELKYSIISMSDKVNITFYYYFKKSKYLPNNYSLVKYYYNEIVKKSNEKIVLIKQ